MKDARGHGSDAHSTGVQQVGQPKTYSWSRNPDTGVHSLTALGSKPIATVGVTQDSAGNRHFKGEYNWASPAGGNASSGYSLHGSVKGAKGYVESQLSRFWEPPIIERKKYERRTRTRQ